MKKTNEISGAELEVMQILWKHDRPMRVQDVCDELEPGKFDRSLCDWDPETGGVLLGDMMICVPRCERQGEELGHGYERELMYLTVHSVLHLLGYDHLDEGPQKAQMRAREEAILETLGLPRE